MDFGLLYVLTDFAHLQYLVSASVSFVAGLVVNYRLSTAWIFRHSKMSNRGAEFTVFALIGVVGLGLNDLLMWVFTSLLGVF